MATRRVCPLCSDSRVVRYDNLSVECPFHDGAVLIELDPEVTDRILTNVIEHARRHPDDCRSCSPEPATMVSPDAASPGHSWRASDLVLLMSCSAALVVAIVVVLRWLW